MGVVLTNQKRGNILNELFPEPLPCIINLSLQSGLVPMEWKAPKVIPLFQNGSMVEFDNYRPLYILPVLSKTLERIVWKQLLSHLENNSLLSSFQFGFRSKRSTELAVTYLRTQSGKKLTMEKSWVRCCFYRSITESIWHC